MDDNLDDILNNIGFPSDDALEQELGVLFEDWPQQPLTYGHGKDLSKYSVDDNDDMELKMSDLPCYGRGKEFKVVVEQLYPQQSNVIDEDVRKKTPSVPIPTKQTSTSLSARHDLRKETCAPSSSNKPQVMSYEEKFEVTARKFQERSQQCKDMRRKIKDVHSVGRVDGDLTKKTSNLMPKKPAVSCVAGVGIKRVAGTVNPVKDLSLNKVSDKEICSLNSSDKKPLLNLASIEASKPKEISYEEKLKIAKRKLQDGYKHCNEARKKVCLIAEIPTQKMTGATQSKFQGKATIRKICGF